MFQIIQSIVDALRRSSNRNRIARQFIQQGFTEVDCPHVMELLPLRFPETIQNDSVCMFQKGDAQVLIVPTAFAPRTRMPHKPRVFILMCVPLGNNPKLQTMSAAIRDPKETYSIVDQLYLDSYPSISPVPDYMVFAADEDSAVTALEVIRKQIADKLAGSIVIHGGRLYQQMSA